MAKNSVVTNSEIAEMLSNGDSLKRFYRFAAQNNHMVLHDICQIVVTHPSASICFSFEEWNSMGRRIKHGKKAIRYIDDDGYMQHVFDVNDTYGDGRYKRLIYPMKRLLGGLDELNGTQTSESDFKDDYSQIYSGVKNYLKSNGYYSGNEQRNTLLTEGIAYSLYSTTGFPKSAGINLQGLPYSLQENTELFKEVYTTAAILQQDIENAYVDSQDRVQVIDDTEEEGVSDEPVIPSEQRQEPVTEVVANNAQKPFDNPDNNVEKTKQPKVTKSQTVTPIYQRYSDYQNEYPDSVVLIRLGDFYEVMGEKAKKVADELDITLTGRDVGLKERVPMCGVPFHAMDEYLDKILEKHSVLLLENDEEPIHILSHAEAQGKKPILEEIDDNEPTPFDEEQPVYVDDIDTRFPIEDDYEDDEEEDFEDYGEADYEDEEEPEKEEVSPQVKNKPQKGIKERKRKEKPQPSLFDYFLPEEKSLQEQLIEHDLKNGSSFEGGKVRIYDKYQENPTIDEFATFLKKEYGDGGSYTEYSQNHSAKGIELKYIDDDNPDNSIFVRLKWNEVAVRIADLIDNDEYFSDEEREKYAEIQRRRAERINAKTDEEKLRVIARQAINDGTGYTRTGRYEIQPYRFEESAQFLCEHKPEFEKVLLQEREIKAIHPTAFPYADNTLVEFYPQFCPRIEQDEIPEQPTEQTDSNSDVIAIGDKYVYRGRTMTVTDLQGIYPNDVVCSYNDSAGGKTYTATMNVDRDDLIKNGVKLREIVVDLTPKGREESPAPEVRTDLNEIGFDQTELGGAKARFRNNVRAIELCKELYSQNRTPTAEEKKILASYVGWGGLPQVFDEHKADWSKEYSELKRVLNADDYDRAKGSVLNSHFTSKEVIDGIYSALKRFGVKGNNRILEPAMGTGNFFGFMPQEISEGSKLYGVELDTVTGRIASKLYPQAKIQIKGYEETSFENNSFDIVVGNVPFGAYSVYDSEYAKQNFYIHDYFLAKSIDKLKPKGVMAVITSKREEIVIDDGEANDTDDDGVHGKEVFVPLKRRARKHLNGTAISTYKKYRDETPESYIFLQNGNGYALIDYHAKEVAEARGLKLINEVVDSKTYSVVPLTVDEMDEILKGAIENGVAARIIEPINYILEEKKITEESDFKEFLDEGLSEIRWLDGRKSGFSEEEVSDLTNDLKPHYEGSQFDKSGGELTFDDWYDDFAEERLKPYLMENYAQKAVADYSQATKQGYEIKARYKEGDREHIVFYRESAGDYAIGYGYNEESGDWAQGTYDIPDFLKAERELISNCASPELVFRPQTEPLPFEHQTIEEGAFVQSVYKDGNANLAIIRRLNDEYVLGIGYNAQTGEFEQGRYNFGDFDEVGKYIDDNFPEAVKDVNFTAEEPINYAELVEKSVENEYKNFYDFEISRTKEQIINTDNYKIRFYNELSVFLGEDGRDFLTDEQYEALYKDSPNIISFLYDYYLGSEYASINNYSDTAELIKDYNDKYHDDVLYPKRQAEAVFYGKDDKDTAYYFLPSLTNNDLSTIEEEASNYVIVAPTNHVTPENLERYRATFLKLGRDVTESELKDMSRAVENLNIIAEQVQSDRLHTPIYYQDFKYAKEHGEEEDYRFSRSLSIKCKEDIQKSISENYNGLSLNTDFVDGLIDKYGIDRIAHVCAFTITDSIYDGRYSDENKEWAKSIPEVPEIGNSAPRLSTHPAILDGFVNIIRKKYNFKEEKEMPEAVENNNKPKWVSIKVSHNALIKQYENYAFLRMPNGSEYAGYAYSIFNNRIHESRQLADLQSDDHELCYEFRMPETATVRLVKPGEEDINLTAAEFKKLVGGTTDKDYKRAAQSDDNRKWYSISIPQEAIRGVYEKSTLFSVPNTSEFKGSVFYAPSSMVKEDKEKQDGSLILRMPENMEIKLLNREDESENTINAEELFNIFSGSTEEDFKSEYKPEEGGSAKDTGWRYVSVDKSAKIADYDERTMFRMPNDGKYSGSVYYIPNRLVQENTKKGTFAVKIPPEFEINLKTPENETVKLDAEEFIQEVKGKEAASYDSALRKPSEAAIKKFEETEKALREHIPEEMLNRPNWVVVRTRKNFDSGRLEKFLINPHTGKFAESDNPETWADFDTACKYAKENGGATLAYALDGKDNIACIDIDHCINESGEYSAVAKDALARCGKTYIETSVSGTGVHIFGKTKGADLRTFSKDGDMEYYRKAHFIAMTGSASKNALESFDNPDMQRMLEDKFDKRVEWKGAGSGMDGLSTMSDREVLEKAFGSKNGETIKRLYNGEDLKNNHSNSDMSLMDHLAFWCHGDKEQILRIFATSGLYRPDKSADYYEGSIIKAIKDNTERYNPPKANINPPRKTGGGNGKV